MCKYFHISKARCNEQLSTTLGVIRAMPEIIDTTPQVEVSNRAIPAIKRLISSSSHIDPILGVLWHGEGIGGSPTIWRWALLTHSEQVLTHGFKAFILRWETAGFTFHCQAHSVEWALANLEMLEIDDINGRAACLWKGTPYEAITHTEMSEHTQQDENKNYT